MKLINSSYVRFNRILCLLFALHFLNLSIDSKDPHPDSIPEDLSFNDIESITEFIAEVVFGWHDAFQEHDEDDNSDRETIDFYKFYVSHAVGTMVVNMDSTKSDAFVSTTSGNAVGPQKDIHSPPPRG